MGSNMAIILLKVAVARELYERNGEMTKGEFDNIVNRMMNELRSRGFDISNNDVIHILDIVDLRGHSVVLSQDGVKYLEMFKIAKPSK